MSKKKSVIMSLISAVMACVCVYYTVKTKDMQFFSGEYGENVPQDYRWIFRLLLSSSLGVFICSLKSLIVGYGKKECNVIADICKTIVFAVVPALLFVGAMHLMQYSIVTDFYSLCCLNAAFTYILIQDRNLLSINEVCSETKKNIEICNIIVLVIFTIAFIISLILKIPRIKYGRVYSFGELILFGTVVISALYVWVCLKNQKRYLHLCVSVMIGAIVFGVLLFNEFQLMKGIGTGSGYSSPELICYPMIWTIVAVEIFNVYRIAFQRICLSEEKL